MRNSVATNLKNKMEKNIMENQIKNSILKQLSKPLSTKQRPPKQLTTQLRLTYWLITSTALILALSSAHIKAACDHKYQESTYASYTIQTSAAHKLCEAIMVNDKAVVLEAIHEINGTDTVGYTPLIQASSQGRTEIVNLLLKLDANVNIRNKGNDTALTVAAREGHTEIVHLLLEHDARVDIQNNKGLTALVLAAQKSKSASIEALILHGADLNIPNKQRKKILKTISPEMQKTIATATAKRQALVLELGQQNWDLTASPQHIIEHFMAHTLASIVCDYADPYHTTEQPLYSAMQRYIHNNKKRSRKQALASEQKSTPTAASASYHAATLPCDYLDMHEAELNNTCALV